MAQAAGKRRQAGQVVLLLVFLAFGLFTAVRGDWFYAAMAVFGCVGVVSALRAGRRADTG